MSSEQQQTGDKNGKGALWMIFSVGIVLAALGSFVPQHFASIDVGGIEVLTGVLLAVGALLSILVS